MFRLLPCKHTHTSSTITTPITNTPTNVPDTVIPTTAINILTINQLYYIIPSVLSSDIIISGVPIHILIIF